MTGKACGTSETGKGRGMIDTGHHSNLVSFIQSQKEKTTTNMCIVQARLARRSLCNTLVSAKRYPTHTWTQVFTVVIFFTIIIMFIYDNASNFDGNCFDGDHGLINCASLLQGWRLKKAKGAIMGQPHTMKQAGLKW